MDNSDIKKSKIYTTIEMVGYAQDLVNRKTIIKKATGSVQVLSFDSGTGISETTFPFDTFAQIIEGKAEFLIDRISVLLQAGQSIIIPAHKSSQIKANERFKMIMTIIKSGYE